MPPAPPFRRLLLLALMLGLVLPVLTPVPAAALESCTDTPTPGYVVRVCLVTPDGDAVLTGEAPVTARVEIVSPTVVPPTVSKVIFSYRTGYLLSDHDADPATGFYDFTWRTQRMIDGTGPFEVKARLSDDVVATHTVNLTVTNGVVTPAANPNTFTVRTGTAPASGQRFRVAAVGDAAAGSPNERRLADQVASWSPNLVTYLGDVYERGSVHEFDNWLGGPQGFGRFRDITNPTVGNHEYLTKDAAGYFDHWDNIGHYYSYDVAGWHVVTIDSTDDYAQLAPGTPQYEWLAEDLGRNRSRCTIVTMHHPRYSLAAGGGRTGLSAVWSLLAARRVTLVLAGHAHHYERWLPLDGAGEPDAARGVTQLVAGAGGHELTPPVGSDSRAVTTVTELGALRLDLGADDASFAYVNADGVERDGGSIGCKSTGDPLPPTVPTGLLVSPSAATTAQLSWNASTDQYSAVKGYTLRRNGVVVATLGAGTTSYTDTGLTSGETYSWTVSAFDTSDNHSAQSAPASTTMPAPSVQQVSSRILLQSLAVRREAGRGFSRTRFRTWLDVDGDRCNTRNEVLLAEAKKPPTLLPACRITGGRWFSAYDGVGTNNRAALGIAHLVPLAEVWASGARGWTAAARARYANDLTYRPTLGVATSRVLRARGAAEPQRWLPPRTSERCGYVAQWVAVKWRWRLSVDKAEKRFLTKRLRNCRWPAVEQPARGWITRR